MSTSPIGRLGLSGLQAATKVQNNSAHNVANINTAGFEPGRTSLEEVPEGVRATVQTGRANPRAESDYSSVDIGQEMVTQITASAMYRANLASIQTEDEVLGTLLDTKR